MRKIVHIALDLDGTLLDSRPQVYESLKSAFHACNLHLSTSLADFIPGPPLDDLILQSSPSLSPTDCLKVKSEFVNQYDNHFCTLSVPYPDISELLHSLDLLPHVRLYLVTNKRIIPTSRILYSLNWFQYFCSVLTPDIVYPHCTKSDLLKSLSATFSIDDSYIYIGDQESDLLSSNSASFQYMHSLWGEGTRLVAPTPFTYLTSPQHLRNVISDMTQP